MGLKDKDNALVSGARPSSIDARAQQSRVFPFGAFEFTDPNLKKAGSEDITLSMSDGWSLDVGEINFFQLDEETKTLVEQGSILAEENALKIKNSDGSIVIQGDTIDIIARELNLEGETINIRANQVNFTGGSGNTLDDITEDDGTNVFIKGDLKVEADDNSRLINIGSKGIQALDSAAQVIHDLPDAASSADYYYMGHYYALSNVNEHSIGVITDVSSTFFTFSGVDIGVSNIRGVRLAIDLDDMIVPGSSLNFNLISTRRYGDTGSWALNQGHVIVYSGTTFSVSSSNIHLVVDVPVDELRRFQVRKGSGVAGNVIIRQLGFFA